MNIQSIQNFLKVAEEASISKVAKSLEISHSTLSRQMKALEEDLGWTLFKRKAQSISLTPVGKLFYAEGKKIVKTVNSSLASIRLQLGTGTIRIGYSPSLAGKILQQAIPQFNKKHPNIRIDLQDLSSLDMRRALAGGKLDLIIDEIGEHQHIQWQQIHCVGRYIVVPVDHSLASKQSIAKSDMEANPFLLYSRAEYPSYWRDMSQYFQENSMTINVIGEFDGLESLTAALQARLGIGIISALSKLPSGCQRIDAEPALPCIKVGIGISSQDPPNSNLQDFINAIKEKAKQLL